MRPRRNYRIFHEDGVSVYKVTEDVEETPPTPVRRQAALFRAYKRLSSQSGPPLKRSRSNEENVTPNEPSCTNSASRRLRAESVIDKGYKSNKPLLQEGFSETLVIATSNEFPGDVLFFLQGEGRRTKYLRGTLFQLNCWESNSFKFQVTWIETNEVVFTSKLCGLPGYISSSSKAFAQDERYAILESVNTRKQFRREGIARASIFLLQYVFFCKEKGLYVNRANGTRLYRDTNFAKKNVAEYVWVPLLLGFNVDVCDDFTTAVKVFAGNEFVTKQLINGDETRRHSNENARRFFRELHSCAVAVSPLISKDIEKIHELALKDVDHGHENFEKRIQSIERRKRVFKLRWKQEKDATARYKRNKSKYKIAEAFIVLNGRGNPSKENLLNSGKTGRARCRKAMCNFVKYISGWKRRVAMPKRLANKVLNEFKSLSIFENPRATTLVKGMSNSAIVEPPVVVAVLILTSRTVASCEYLMKLADCLPSTPQIYRHRSRMHQHAKAEGYTLQCIDEQNQVYCGCMRTLFLDLAWSINESSKDARLNIALASDGGKLFKTNYFWVLGLQLQDPKLAAKHHGSFAFRHCALVGGDAEQIVKADSIDAIRPVFQFYGKDIAKLRQYGNCRHQVDNSEARCLAHGGRLPRQLRHLHDGCPLRICGIILKQNGKETLVGALAPEYTQANVLLAKKKVLDKSLLPAGICCQLGISKLGNYPADAFTYLGPFYSKRAVNERDKFAIVAPKLSEEEKKDVLKLLLNEKHKGKRKRRKQWTTFTMKHKDWKAKMETLIEKNDWSSIGSLLYKDEIDTVLATFIKLHDIDFRCLNGMVAKKKVPKRSLQIWCEDANLNAVSVRGLLAYLKQQMLDSLYINLLIIDSTATNKIAHWEDINVDFAEHGKMRIACAFLKQLTFFFIKANRKKSMQFWKRQDKEFKMRFPHLRLPLFSEDDLKRGCIDFSKKIGSITRRNEFFKFHTDFIINKVCHSIRTENCRDTVQSGSEQEMIKLAHALQNLLDLINARTDTSGALTLHYNDDELFNLETSAHDFVLNMVKIWGIEENKCLSSFYVRLLLKICNIAKRQGRFWLTKCTAIENQGIKTIQVSAKSTQMGGNSIAASVPNENGGKHLLRFRKRCKYEGVIKVLELRNFLLGRKSAHYFREILGEKRFPKDMELREFFEVNYGLGCLFRYVFFNFVGFSTDQYPFFAALTRYHPTINPKLTDSLQNAGSTHLYLRKGQR